MALSPHLFVSPASPFLFSFPPPPLSSYPIPLFFPPISFLRVELVDGFIVYSILPYNFSTYCHSLRGSALNSRFRTLESSRRQARFNGFLRSRPTSILRRGAFCLNSLFVGCSRAFQHSSIPSVLPTPVRSFIPLLPCCSIQVCPERAIASTPT